MHLTSLAIHALQILSKTMDEILPANHRQRAIILPNFVVIRT
jgi:hypothetical protein